MCRKHSSACANLLAKRLVRLSDNWPKIRKSLLLLLLSTANSGSSGLYNPNSRTITVLSRSGIFWLALSFQLIEPFKPSKWSESASCSLHCSRRIRHLACCRVLWTCILSRTKCNRCKEQAPKDWKCNESFPDPSLCCWGRKFWLFFLLNSFYSSLEGSISFTLSTLMLYTATYLHAFEAANCSMLVAISSPYLVRTVLHRLVVSTIGHPRRCGMFGYATPDRVVSQERPAVFRQLDNSHSQRLMSKSQKDPLSRWTSLCL